MTDPICYECGKPASDPRHRVAIDTPDWCPVSDLAIYRRALAEAQADSAKLREALESGATHIPIHDGDEVVVMNFTLIQQAGVHPADTLLHWHAEKSASRQPDPAQGESK